MMLHNTSLRIKRFVTQRQYKSVQNLGYEIDNPRFSELQISINGPKRLSWSSETPSAEHITRQRSNSNATLQSHHTHHPNTAHSSASSLCSCDCEENPVPIEQSLSRVDSPIAQQEILYLPSAVPANDSDDEKSWRLIFPEHLPRSSSLSPASKPYTRPPYLTITPIEAKAAPKVPGFNNINDNDKTPTQSIKVISDTDMDDLSANVEQLIRETDKAFKAVGSALADAKAATHGWYDTNSSPAPHTFSISRDIMRQSRSPVAVSPHRTPITKTKLTVKTKGKSRKLPTVEKKKSTLFGRVSRSRSPRPQVHDNTSSRWRLNDVTANMVDVFSGRRFRTEADEMLTPMRIQRLRDQVAAENERRISDESTRSSITTEIDGDGDIGSPTEPFHLEELSERIDAVNRAATPPAPILIPKTSPPPNEAIALFVEQPSDLSKRAAILLPDPQTPFISTSKPDMVFKNITFPTPPIPARNPRRISSLTKGIPLLPTIPEISPLSLSPTQFLQFPTTPSPTTPISNLPTYIFLPSTQYSLLSPAFKHGSIRIDNLRKLRKEEGATTEEGGLDWVAFQMAISGNMDEYVGNERSDSEWELDEVEIDEIEAWWESFGFGLGGLIGEEKHLKSMGMEDVALKNLGVVGAEEEQVGNLKVTSLTGDDQLETQTSSKGLDDISHIIEEEPLQEQDPDPAPAYQLDPKSPKPQNLTAPPIPERRRPSLAESMPPSPMLDLGIISPKDEDIVPMGFNLGHDLGDFLLWETNHVTMFMKDD